MDEGRESADFECGSASHAEFLPIAGETCRWMTHCVGRGERAEREKLRAFCEILRGNRVWPIHSPWKSTHLPLGTSFDSCRSRRPAVGTRREALMGIRRFVEVGV